MRKTGILALTCLVSCGFVTNAYAADMSVAEEDVVAIPPPMYDVSVGVKLATDYVLRGITKTSGDPQVQGYVEVSFLQWAFAGVLATNVHYPTSKGFSGPSSEIHIYGGLRHSWGPLTFEGGYRYFWYPGEAKAAREMDFYRIYGQATYRVGEIGSFGANLWWTGDNSNSGADQTHSSIFGKLNLPKLNVIGNTDAYVSGEIGRRWITKNRVGFEGPDYNFWNVGLAAKYKSVTFDLRYHDSDLSKDRCRLASGVRDWCGDRYVLSMSFDTSFSKLK